MGIASRTRFRMHTRQKYDSILKSASRLFMRYGYTHTSMDAIAEHARVSKQTVYSYFSSKEQLFRRMIEDLCSSNTPPASVLEDMSLSPKETLLSFAQGFMETISSNSGLGIYRLVMAEAQRHPRVAELFFQSGPQKQQDIMKEYLRRQVAAGHFKIADIDHAAGHFFGMIKGWYQMRMVLKLKPSPTKNELEAHVRATVCAFCSAYER